MKNNKYSNYKISWFPDKLQSFLKREIIAPIYVHINPTNRCNHNCFYCAYNVGFSRMHETMKRQDELTTKKILETLDDFKDMGINATTYSGGGEPLLHPGILDIIQKTKDNGIFLSMITNGQLLNGAKALAMREAKWIRVSTDYSNYETFKKIRGGSEKAYETLLDNLRSFKSIKADDCNFGMNFIVSKMNYTEIYEASRLFAPIVENIRFSPVWTPDFYEYHQPIISQIKEQLDAAKKDFETDECEICDSFGIVRKDASERHYDKCYVQQTIPVVAADGIVYACHNKSYTNDGAIGSLANQTFKQLWYSTTTAKFFESFNPKITCNHQCSNDRKNAIISELIGCAGDSFV